MSPLKKILLSLLATCAILLALEWGVRLSLGFPRFFFPGGDNCLQRDPSLGLKFVGDCAAAWSDDLLTGKTVTEFTTNSLGLRDAELLDDGAIRILALGDSCTWGWQVHQQQAFPQVLQRLLSDRVGPHAYRVINAGAPGYTSYQGLTFLRDYGLGLRPSVVLIGFGFNDAQPTGEVEGALAAQRRFFRFIQADDFLLEHSALWRWMRALTHAKPRYDLPSRVSPDRFRANIASMVEASRGAGAIPILISFAGDPAKDPYARVLADIARELKVAMVDYTGPRLDIVHPTASGYTTLATALAPLIDQLDLSTAPPGGRKSCTFGPPISF